MDDEVQGEGNWQDYGMRMYNPRIGRFPNVDPLTKSYPMLTPYQFASNSPISGVDLDGLEYYYAADGKLLGHRTKDSQGKLLPTEISNDVRIASGVRETAEYTLYDGIVSLNIQHKDFLDRSHITYGEGGASNIYTLQNGTPNNPKDDIIVNPAQFFADAIQNAVEKHGSEESMKLEIWKISSKRSYKAGTIQTEGHNNPPNDVSPYNVFNNARIKFENGDMEALNSPLFHRCFAATISAIVNKDKTDLVNDATNWVSNGEGDTWNSLLDTRDPTVMITNATRWVTKFTTFYKLIDNKKENDGIRKDLTITKK